jgi:F0F1-type ATP synthase membrane subunit b/b'
VLKIISDFLQAASDYIGPKYEETKAKGSEYIKDAQATAEHYKDLGEKKLSEYQKLGEQKTEQAKQEASKAKDEANKKLQK